MPIYGIVAVNLILFVKGNPSKLSFWNGMMIVHSSLLIQFYF
mgnify:CR=1 FL=1